MREPLFTWRDVPEMLQVFAIIYAVILACIVPTALIVSLLDNSEEVCWNSCETIGGSYKLHNRLGCFCEIGGEVRVLNECSDD